MPINFNIKKTFKINGKEYRSVDEMPPEVREMYQKAMAALGGSQGDGAQTVVTRTVHSKINFNGKEYERVDEMPDTVRKVYESVMKAVERGALPGGDAADPGQGAGTTGLHQTHGPKELNVEAAFSLRSLLIGAGVIGLLIVAYLLLK
ncbi:MAG: hypothetical protein M0042_16730 [Nitrospiraceae bacterium]|nr:hypothetical protein [Nitrospiraceae bacterium]